MSLFLSATVFNFGMIEIFILAARQLHCICSLVWFWCRFGQKQSGTIYRTSDCFTLESCEMIVVSHTY